jgi:hypothetical protein
VKIDKFAAFYALTNGKKTAGGLIQDYYAFRIVTCVLAGVFILILIALPQWFATGLIAYAMIAFLIIGVPLIVIWAFLVVISALLRNR